LEEAEIGKNKAARWQQVAAIPEEKFSAYIQTNEEKGKELTTAGVLLPVMVNPVVSIPPFLSTCAPSSLQIES
jgi:hypothetical protein